MNMEADTVITDSMLKYWESAPTAMGIYEYTPEGVKVVYLNDRYYKMIGSSKEDREIYQNSALSAIYPEDAAQLYAAVKKSVAEGGEIDIRVRILMGSGSYGWFGLRATHTSNGDGTYRFYVVFFDITELIETEEELARKVTEMQRTKEMHDFSIAGTDIFIWEYDLVKDEITFADNPFTVKRKREIGYPDVVPNASKYIMANVMPESIPTMQRILDEMRSGKEQTGGDIHFRAGGDEGYTICRISYRVMKDESGRPVKAYGSEQNITDSVVLRDSYARELARFENNADKDVIFKSHASLTQNRTFSACVGGRVISSNGVYDDEIARLFSSDVTTSDGTPLSELFNRGNAIANYAEGDRYFTFEYRWPGLEVWKWIRADVVLAQNPETSDIEIFLYCIDDTTDRMQKLIVDRLGSAAYDYIAVVSVQDGTYLLQTDEGIVESADKHTYKERAEYLLDEKIPEEFRDQAREALGFERILSGIEESGVYVVNTTETDTDDNICYKMRQFFWLDDEKKLFLICVTDVTETVVARHSMEERIESDKAILQQASMDAYDFIAVIDCTTEMITLRSGSWFNRDVPTPEEMRILPYIKLIDYIANNYTLSEEEKTGFAEKFSLANVKSMLRQHEELYFPFDFIDATDKSRVKYKQFRFTWLDGSHTKILAARSDVTSAMESEKQLNLQMKEALEAAEAANNAKSEFLSRMSHDIRTPMNAIIGFSTLLLKNADNPEKVENQSRKILYSSNHLLGLINDVLDMSKIETGKLQMNVREFSLADTINMISEIMRPQMGEKRQSFDVYVSGLRHERYVADNQRLQQILVNVLSNATKYTQTEGHITLRIGALPEHSGRYETITFEVEDNGRGMSEDYQKIIFEPFSREQLSNQEQAQGTGLGMAITKNLVNIMGGTISVTSKLGEGSRFTIALPMQLPNEDEDKYFWQRHAFTHMLVVDDEQEICDNIIDSMRETGVRMEYALDGRTSVDMLSTAHDEKDDFDIVLLDWQMPGMDGIETAREIRKILPPDVLIIILTAYDYSEIEVEARKAGVDGFMSKPFFTQELARAIMGTERYAEDTGAEVDIEVQQESDDELPEDSMAGLSVLAAEDNELNAEILTELMNIAGATVTVVPDGGAAVERFMTSEVGEFDIILMDVQMPVMNGYEATRAIRALAEDVSLSTEKIEEALSIPIIAMTANAFSDDVQNSIESGMNAHVSKPLDMKVMRRTIHEVLSKR